MTTNEIIKPVRIVDEMRSSYIDYAMSVIVARALPDVRDGLKPVHRRILYSMDGLSMRPGSSYKKSARLVGEVLGKYHPHGDSSVYDAMVRLAQDFSMRYPLVDGQGNFGSIDDDPPAAMRYTEAKLASIAMEMLNDIDRGTVDFVPNFDDSLTEPVVLPSRIPNLIVNGSTGIAVGMTTNIPPHNLSEICDGIVHLIKNPRADTDELMEYIQGPDFPTGALIMGTTGIREAFETGRGRVVIRSNIEIEELGKNGRYQFIINDIPFMTNKANLVQKIATLAKEKKIEGISEIRDESDRTGMRIVIELRRDAQAQVVKNILYKQTALQTSIHYNMLALVDGQPQTLSLKSVLQHYIDFREEIIRRRTQFEIDKANARIHILQGLKTALDNLDEIIELIRNSDDTDSARQSLITGYALDEIQANAILDMQLRRFAALEQKRIEDEYDTLIKSVTDYLDLLGDRKQVLSVIESETLDLKKKFGDERKTQISLEEISGFNLEDQIPHQETIITLSNRGYIKSIPASTFRRQHRGGKGVRGQTTREDDWLKDLVVCDNHDILLFFTDRGRVYKNKVYQINTDISRTTRGTPLVQYLNLKPDEKVQTILAVESLEEEEKDLLFSTKLGEIKRMDLKRIINIRANGIKSMDLENGDELTSVRLSDRGSDVLMVSQQGISIRFPSSEVRSSSRIAGGVRGMRLRNDDVVVAMDIVDPNGQLLVISEKGYGKPTSLNNYRTAHRGGYGVATFRITSKSGLVATARVVKEAEDILIISEQGQVTRTSLAELRILSRRTQGVSIVSMDEKDKTVSIASMDPILRNARDTQPKAARGKEAALESTLQNIETDEYGVMYNNDSDDNSDDNSDE
jgi:DNA gyrase subunit A